MCGPREARKAALWADEEWRHGRIPVHLITARSHARDVATDSWLASAQLAPSTRGNARFSDARLRIWPEKRVGLDVSERVEGLIVVRGDWTCSQVEETHRGTVHERYSYNPDAALRYDRRLFPHAKQALLGIDVERVPGLHALLTSLGRLGSSLLEAV